LKLSLRQQQPTDSRNLPISALVGHERVSGADIVSVRNEYWPFRRSDALFVVAVVMFALPDPGTDWNFGISSTAMRLGLVVAVVSVWIRFRVFGGGDQGTR
jgi:hypothetical protein